MKTNLYVEFHDKQLEDKSLIAAVKKSWTEAGHKLGNIKTMNLYVKPEENAVYYVINETENGKVEL